MAISTHETHLLEDEKTGEGQFGMALLPAIQPQALVFPTELGNLALTTDLLLTILLVCLAA